MSKVLRKLVRNMNPEQLKAFWQERALRRELAKRGVPITAEMIAGREEEFWSHVDRTQDGCWFWNGIDGGYNSFKIGSHHYACHRVAYALTHGSIPNMMALHKCDNPSCVRPDHLFLGDAVANLDDMVSKGRQPAHWTQVKGQPLRSHAFSH